MAKEQMKEIKPSSSSQKIWVVVVDTRDGLEIEGLYSSPQLAEKAQEMLQADEEDFPDDILILDYELDKMPY